MTYGPLLREDYGRTSPGGPWQLWTETHEVLVLQQDAAIDLLDNGRKDGASGKSSRYRVFYNFLHAHPVDEHSADSRLQLDLIQFDSMARLRSALG